MLDPGPEAPLNRHPASDAIRHTNDSYDNYGGPVNFGARARKTAINYENYRRWDGAGLQFSGSRETNIEDDSGVCSPPLWKTSPGTSPHRDQNNYRYLSPASKAQAIARGQRELMEMIRNMPESSYELSLKDLVEQQPRNDIRHQSTVAEETTNSGTEVLYRKEKVEKKMRKNDSNNNKKAQMMRSGSMDKGGFLLKMVFPFSFGSKNKKKIINSSATKVSPKPQTPSDGSAKGVDKEWWKKRFSVYGESESGGTSSNSGSTGSSGSSRSSSSGSSSNRQRSDSSMGCWSFFRIKKQNGEIKKS